MEKCLTCDLHISGTTEPIGFIQTAHLWRFQGLSIARLPSAVNGVEVGIWCHQKLLIFLENDGNGVKLKHELRVKYWKDGSGGQPLTFPWALGGTIDQSHATITRYPKTPRKVTKLRNIRREMAILGRRVRLTRWTDCGTINGQSLLFQGPLDEDLTSTIGTRADVIKSI